MLNDINQDNNKVLEHESNKNVKFHRLEKSTEEAVSKLQSVVEAEQQMADLRKSASWQKIKTLPEFQTRNRVWTNPPRDKNYTKAVP